MWTIFNSDKKTKYTNPYDYDPITIFHKEDSKTGVYSDRLSQWDHEKYNRLCKKHFGNIGQYWDKREPEKVEAFLRDYIGKQNLMLCNIVEYCNVATGYPVWYFGYKEE